MTFVLQNLRLKELAAVAQQNRPAFDDFCRFLRENGYSHLSDFIWDKDDDNGLKVIDAYLRSDFPKGVALLDGIARPYPAKKAKWLLLGWILRDAPEQRLRPMVSSMAGGDTIEKQAQLLNSIRIDVATIFQEKERWEWVAISEVVIDRLEGSRRSIKGTLFEAIVRRLLADLFGEYSLNLEIGKTEIKLGGETYDVSVVGRGGTILLPVKTRETMGGGHALLFTRDIHKSIAVAKAAGNECIPIVIAESWAGNLDELECDHFVYINKNPNQIKDVENLLHVELRKNIRVFEGITQ